MYRQVLDPVAHSLGWSAVFAALPLIVLFVALGVLRLTAWISALVGLAVALIVATVVYPMPVGQALLSASLGAAFGFFPILWIVINAIWIYRLTVQTGDFDMLRRSFSRVSSDQRIQAVMIAFCFGALMEAGFGAPVVISAVMLMALGFTRPRAATVALVANTAPVAFGALAIPITTLSAVTGLPVHDLGSTVGRQVPVLAVFVPLALVSIVDGGRGLRQAWVPALTCGVVFGFAQFVTSNYISVPLTDVIASLAAAGALALLLRVWQPSDVAPGPAEAAAAGGSVHEHDAAVRERVAPRDTPAAELRAYLPYLVIIATFAIAQLPRVAVYLNMVTRTWNWPGLHIQNPTGKALTVSAFTFNWLTAAGSLMLLAGAITVVLLRVPVGQAVRGYGATLNQLKWAILTVMSVLALAYVMNASGQTATLGTWMARAGAAFAIIAPLLGWLGVAVTGSDTSSNSLFGALQVTAAHQAGLNVTLMAAANSSGGVLGKMISPQNLAVAAAAVGLGGREGDIFRRVFAWSLLLLSGMCLLVYLQSTPVLSWTLR